jgi:hypothetical protein
VRQDTGHHRHGQGGQVSEMVLVYTTQPQRQLSQHAFDISCRRQYALEGIQGSTIQLCASETFSSISPCLPPHFSASVVLRSMLMFKA